MDANVLRSEKLTGLETQQRRTFFRETIKPPPGAFFELLVEAFQPEPDSISRVIAFNGRSTDRQQELMPYGLEIVDMDDQPATHLAKIVSRIFSKVPVSQEVMVYTLQAVLGDEPDPNRPLHKRIVDELARNGVSPTVLARYPLDKVDFSDI